MTFVSCKKCEKEFEIEIYDDFAECPNCGIKYEIDIEDCWDGKTEWTYLLLGDEIK